MIDLDWFVADKVMGWEMVYCDDPVFCPDPFWNWCEKGGGRGMYRVAEWKPATDIVYAWKVVEEVMHAKPAMFHLDRDFETGEPYGPSGYRAFLGGGGAWGKTAEEAICRAALKAYGVEV